MSIAYTLYIPINLLYHPTIDFFQIIKMLIHKYELSSSITCITSELLNVCIFIFFEHSFSENFE